LKSDKPTTVVAVTDKIPRVRPRYLMFQSPTKQVALSVVPMKSTSKAQQKSKVKPWKKVSFSRDVSAQGKSDRPKAKVAPQKRPSTSSSGKSTSAGLRRLRALRRSMLTSGDVKRLARRGGVKRMAASVKETTEKVLRSFLENIVGDAIKYTENAKRRTVTVGDVLMALKHNNRTLLL